MARHCGQNAFARSAPVKGAAGILALLLLLPAVSIHAPVKGATALLEIIIEVLSVSIHAPVKGGQAETKPFEQKAAGVDGPARDSSAVSWTWIVYMAPSGVRRFRLKPARRWMSSQKAKKVPLPKPASVKTNTISSVDQSDASVRR